MFNAVSWDTVLLGSFVRYIYANRVRNKFFFPFFYPREQYETAANSYGRLGFRLPSRRLEPVHILRDANRRFRMVDGKKLRIEEAIAIVFAKVLLLLR